MYWEPEIKTYGFQIKSGLRLITAMLPFDRVAELGEIMEGGSEPLQHFIMVLAQPTNTESLRVHLLLEPSGGEQITDLIRKTDVGASGAVSGIGAPVELIYFQGPHFGDRYGIADAVFRALDTQSIQVLAAGCSGASIYIVVPDKKAETAIRCLSGSFKVPKTTTR